MPADKPPIKIIVEIDEAELAVRMCEASYGLERPTPSGKQALDAMATDCREGWLRAARAAIAYFRECCVNGQVPS